MIDHTSRLHLRLQLKIGHDAMFEITLTLTLILFSAQLQV